MSNMKEISELALDAMEKHAKKIGAIGVGVFLYAKEEDSKNWYSEMRIIGAINTIAKDGSGYNFIALAYSKAAESIETRQISGCNTRPLITGEFGYKGSAITQYENGFVITAFSGSTEDVDYEIAKSGLSCIIKKQIN